MKKWTYRDRAALLPLLCALGCAEPPREPTAPTPENTGFFADAHILQARGRSFSLEVKGDLASADDLDLAHAAAALVDGRAIEAGTAVGGGGADINQRPIRVWFVKGADGVDDVYVLGHADGECCPIVSQALSTTVRNPAFKDAWFSYGVGLFHAAGDAERRAALSSLVTSLDTISHQPVCKGQLMLTAMSTDRVVAGSARIQRIADDLLGRAKGLGRPIMLWHPLDDEMPRLVPIVVRDSADHPTPLEFRVPIEELRIPHRLINGLTLDGTARYVAQLRTLLARLETLMEVQEHARKLEGGIAFQINEERYATNFRGKIEKVVQTSLAKARTYIAKWQALDRIQSTIGVKDDRIALALEELEGARQSCELALAQARALPDLPTSNQATPIEFLDVVPDAGANPFAFVLTSDTAKEHAEVTAKLREMLARPVTAPTNPVPVLVDAFLRGWPATFSANELSNSYDQWVHDHQKRIWTEICEKLATSGVRFGSCTGGRVPALQLSNVMFQVRVNGDDVVVRPTFVLAGASMQIADPAAGLVRYESTLADQNLVHLP